MLERLLIFLIALALCAASETLAQDQSVSKVESVSSGRSLAQDICAYCHDIGRDRPFTPIMQPPAPSFETLARRRKLDEANLRRFLAAPHGGVLGKTKMPNPELLDYQIDALLAYLRTRPRH
ncbi:hypothetical protein OGR47_06180 [Methylocystis sp. MJC1]|jgi:cytochrome c2|uniref:c-type cytochrome n=1 Tax=Methylocystis sp. MJC1 TaxID=2654282 RepID=UPI0013EA08DA|nr:c-type cytochrome [Methylocystis sp. MJC1]KAF2992620.1 hypothetical protein MJC1_00198 [Methylocystis sp. MJC1]MBU6526587.1 hypothetical protein [Methylocystis sp. MJC1]UZX13033.1 hypothetical protein OGR47_06180 [Methylocystis sp. MJC1]